MKRCVGEYREEIICIVVPRHEVAWELDADYIGEGCYDYHNHLWYDDGTYGMTMVLICDVIALASSK